MATAHRRCVRWEARQARDRRYGQLYCRTGDRAIRSGGMDVAVPWRWMAQHPLRFLRSSAPWRCWLYVATGAPLGLVTMAAVAVLTLVGAVLSPIVVGLALLTAA